MQSELSHVILKFIPPGDLPDTALITFHICLVLFIAFQELYFTGLFNPIAFTRSENQACVPECQIQLLLFNFWRPLKNW